jgi:hypothetical protein
MLSMKVPLDCCKAAFGVELKHKFISEILDKNCIVLIMDWVLESIESCKLASAFNYLPSGVTFTQISQAHYDLPLEMLDNNSS